MIDDLLNDAKERNAEAYQCILLALGFKAKDVEAIKGLIPDHLVYTWRVEHSRPDRDCVVAGTLRRTVSVTVFVRNEVTTIDAEARDAARKQLEAP